MRRTLTHRAPLELTTTQEHICSTLHSLSFSLFGLAAEAADAVESPRHDRTLSLSALCDAHHHAERLNRLALSLEQDSYRLRRMFSNPPDMDGAK